MTPATIAPEGRTKSQFLFDPTNPALSLPADVKFDRPRPLDVRALPVYPERALVEGDGPHREAVRIVIDEHGSVTQVLDSPMESSDAGPHAAEFRLAVEAAVRSWRFQPGVLRKVEPGHDVDGDGKIDYTVTKSSDPIAVYYDIRFTFEIVDGRGVVTRRP